MALEAFLGVLGRSAFHVMHSSRLQSLVLLIGLALMPLSLPASESETTIARARAFVGTEEAINALRSVHFSGVLETTEMTPEGPRSVEAKLEIIFQRPFRQRIVVTRDDRTEITALDDYEGWQRVDLGEEPRRWRLTLLGREQIRRLRANTWENLAFFRGLDERGGRVEDLGLFQTGGVRTRKLAFVHASDIVFYRYFEEETGRLVLTETERGGRIREEGEIRVGGLRFPSKIITTNKLADGSEREVVVFFERISINETLPDDFFTVPRVESR